MKCAVLLLPMTGVGWLIGLVANADAIGFAYFFDVLSSLQVKEQFQFFYYHDYRKETLLLQLFRFYIAVFLKHDIEELFCPHHLFTGLIPCYRNLHCQYRGRSIYAN